MDFVEQLKSSVDIVSVIGEWVRLRKAGANRYSGLCPFHSEKTPSFSVNASKQFYYCFGCHATGDVLKFVMEIEGVSFYEALKSLAERQGIPVPKRAEYTDEESRKRAALLRMHELAQEHFSQNLQSTAGEAARRYLAQRGVAPEIIQEFGLGYAERSGRGLVKLFEGEGFTPELMEESGLTGKRADGGFYDRFRNRLMFPIHNEKGKIIAYGGRALDPEDQPKYLNSPETPIYKKSHVLYNLHRAKDAIRKGDRSILVEGYMDVIGVTAAGFAPVVASCGTALTLQQVQTLRRHSQKIVVNFDPDSAGAAGAERSIALLLSEGMFVSILELEDGLDPDEYCKERGANAYGARLNQASSYFHWLADRARAKHDVKTPEGVIAVLQALVPAVQRITGRVERMAVAEELAAYVGVERGIVLDSFRKTVAGQEKTISRPKETVRADEKGLLHVLFSDADGRDRLLAELQHSVILDRLATCAIFHAIRAVHAAGGAVTFDAVNARLGTNEQALLAELMLAEETEEQEISFDYGLRCIESLQRSEEQLRRAELKAQVKQAERAGKIEEALRLAGELERLETRELKNVRLRRPETLGDARP